MIFIDILRRISNFIYFHMEMVKYKEDVWSDNPPLPNPRLNFQVRLLSPNDLDRFPYSSSLGLKEVKRRLERGEVCNTIIYNGKIVAYCWFVLRGNYTSPWLGKTTFVLEDKQVYIYNLFVDEGLRNKGLAAYLIYANRAYLRSLGMKSAVFFVWQKNRSAISLYKRFGYKQEGRVSFFRVMGREFCRMKTKK